MPIYRIRRYSGYKGESNYYYHADVVASRPKSALLAAQEGRVCNWRWIDSFDTSAVNYERFELLYNVSYREAKNPQRPKSRKLMFLERRIGKVNGVSRVNIRRNKFDTKIARVVVSRHSNLTRKAIRKLLRDYVDENVRVCYTIRPSQSP